MSFIHNLNIIQHHNNEIHKNLLELYNNIETRIHSLQTLEENLKQKENELKQREEDIQNFNKVSIIKSQDKKIHTLERRLTRLSIKQTKEKNKQNKKSKKKEPEPEGDEEEFEVYVKTIRRKKYYVSNTDEIYTILDDEEVGDCIGVLKNNKLVRHKKTKK